MPAVEPHSLPSGRSPQLVVTTGAGLGSPSPVMKFPDAAGAVLAAGGAASAIDCEVDWGSEQAAKSIIAAVSIDSCKLEIFPEFVTNRSSGDMVTPLLFWFLETVQSIKGYRREV